MQTLRKKAPWIPKPTKVQSFSKEGSLMYYQPENNSFGINPEEMVFETYSRGKASFIVANNFDNPETYFNAVMAHEFGHMVSTNLREKAKSHPKSLYKKKKWSKWESERQKLSSNMLAKMEDGYILFSKYPIYVATKHGRSLGIEETWAEIMSAYFSSEKAQLPKEILQFLDSLFL